MEATFIVVGGGIAGVTCVETLSYLQPNQSIILISESALIKTVTNIQKLTENITSFDVENKESKYLSDTYHNVKIIHDSVAEVESATKKIKTIGNLIISYQYLCLCTGARPNLAIPLIEDYVLGIRDTDSVENFVEKLSSSKKIAVLGNGGIASEIVHKIDNVEVHWIIREDHISATFIDAGAGEFFQEALHNKKNDQTTILKRWQFHEHGQKSGAALGPDWYQNLHMTGKSSARNIVIHSQSGILNVKKNEEAEEFPICVTLSNGEIINCDLVVSATGVLPQLNFKITDAEFRFSENSGISVASDMQTDIKCIYAAGDVCMPNWKYASCWFPMKLWTQARQMGYHSANCISAAFNNVKPPEDFCFELFTHSTKLFGFKVVLLGSYNGQFLDKNEMSMIIRMTKGVEYIKFILCGGRLKGAILIGETDLEETAENLILNQIDISIYGEDILNPYIDIEDYFD